VNESRLREVLPKTMWTPLGDLSVRMNDRIHLRCVCGLEKYIVANDIIRGSLGCLQCVMKKRSAEREVHPYETKYPNGEFERVKHTLTGAKQRCTNPNCAQYNDYGGRGIRFFWDHVSDGAEWVLDNVGPKPSPTHTIDRIDNNKGYEPGNLRWATRAEQSTNKRQYKRTENGERIRRVLAVRDDVTYETVRIWVKAGLTDEQMMTKGKYARPSI